MSPSLSFATPLSQLLAALDRLPADLATQTLARDMARVCVDEGRSVTAQALVTAAQAQLRVTVQSAPQDSRSLLDPRWSRPTTRVDWERARQAAQETLATHRQDQRRLHRRAWGVLSVSLLGFFVATLGAVLNNALVLHVGTGAELLAVIGALRLGHQVPALMKLIAEEEATLQQLDVFAGSLRDEAVDSALAQAYAAQHTAQGVPLLNGDEKTLHRLNAMEATYTRVAAWLPPSDTGVSA